MSYVDGFLLAVPAANKQAFAEQARAAFRDFFRPKGAIEFRENWGDDVPDGKVTSFPLAVKLEPGEVVVFSWIIWPDKATRDAAYKGMEDTVPPEMPFDATRMMWGGFQPLVTEND